MPITSTSHARTQGAKTQGRTAKRRAPAKHTSRQQDAIKLLIADHDEVEKLFKQFQKMKGNGADKGDVLERICKALSVHAEIEEEIFYPAARDALAEDGEDILNEAEVEHASIKNLVEQLEDADPDDDMVDAKVKVLCEYVTHHVKEEEGEMFPKIKKADLDLQALGEELAERKMELMGEEGAEAEEE